jgi:hypothetical protein
MKKGRFSVAVLRPSVPLGAHALIGPIYETGPVLCSASEQIAIQ